MAIIPNTSRKQLPIPLAMSTAQNADQQQSTPSSATSTGTATFTPVTPSPIPNNQGQRQQQPYDETAHAAHLHNTLAPRPHVAKPSWPNKPRLNLKVQDVSHAAARLFFQAFIATEIFEEAIDAVLTGLYRSPESELGRDASCRPPVKSITLVLRSMDGVAYTCGNDELSDGDHKEIHFSLNHIKNTMDNARRKAEEQRKQSSGASSAMDVDDGAAADAEIERAVSRAGAAEIHGVLVHEMVHCWQWNGSGSAPGGLVEGVADYVRLKEGLAPPHWNRASKGDRWDAGYERTAYFLEWCETRLGRRGQGKVQELNAWLQHGWYDDKDTWEEIFGKSVGELWKAYKADSS